MLHTDLGFSCKSAVALLLGHVSDTSVDIKLERVTAGQYICRHRGGGNKGLRAALSVRVGALILLMLQTPQTKAVSPASLPNHPHRHGDINARSRPASVPPCPRPACTREGRGRFCELSGRDGFIAAGVESEKQEERTEIKATEGVIDEDRDERAQETGRQRVKYPDSLTAKRIRL